MRKRLGSLLLAVSLSFGMVAMPFFDAGVNVAYADGENVIRKAELQGDGTIKLNVKNPISTETDYTSSAKVTDESGNEIKVTKCSINGRRGTMELESSPEMGHTYTVSIDGFENTTIDLSGLFSTDAFESEYTYDGDDLGATWSSDKTSFKVWAPLASSVKVNLYKSGAKDADDLIESIDMTKGDKGVWSAEKEGDLNGTYYTYAVVNDGTEREATDPYGKAVGVNGDRSMVINLDSTDPDGWDKDERQTVVNITDAVIYELHVRDFSASASSGIPEEHKGKYLAFTDKGTTTESGVKTGIDHIAELGVNMVHILPSYDFGSVDETQDKSYNWGYDPKNYQVPEGSYSTDATNGATRVNEYKQMVQALHNEGIGVIQDCVYNHTQSLAFNYNYLVPGYYHRSNSNGSGCGNDVASERSMVRKYIVDSVSYWADEYHLDGFRFDLMGLEDVDTMNAVRKALNEIDPSIIIYGEGWTQTTSITKDILLATQKNCSATEGIAYFSDGIRDAVVNASYGSEGKKPGYANGAKTNIDDMKGYITARYTSNAKDKAVSPTQVINYVTCHDGFTLWDKIKTSNGSDSEDDQKKQAKLSYAMILTAQGTPFILSGDEFLRTKTDSSGKFVSNSYMSGDDVNALDYSRIDTYSDVYEYMKGLIAFRGAHSALRYTTFDDIDSTYTWLDGLDDQVIAYTVKGGVNNEVSDNLLVVYNPNKTETKITLPEGEWKVCVNGEKAGTDVIETVSGELTVSPISCYALVQGETAPAVTDTNTNDDSTTSAAATATPAPSSDNGGSNPLPYIIVIAVVVVMIVVIVKKKK